MGYHLLNDSLTPKRPSEPSPHLSERLTLFSWLNGRGHRYCSPNMGRWLSRDPRAYLARTGMARRARNRESDEYAFVLNDAIGSFDAIGLFKQGTSFTAQFQWPWGEMDDVGTLKIQTYTAHPAFGAVELFGHAGAELKITTDIKPPWTKCFLFRWRQTVTAIYDNNKMLWFGTDAFGNIITAYADGSWFDGAKQRGDGSQWYYKDEQLTFYDYPDLVTGWLDPDHKSITEKLTIELVAIRPRTLAIPSGGYVIWKGTYGFQMTDSSNTLIDE